jgi:hypothetical protein
VERFGAAVAGIEGLETRKMFGYPAGFIGGNMVTGLHQESWIVRLPDTARGWVARAAAHVRTMPPKVPQPRKRR